MTTTKEFLSREEGGQEDKMWWPSQETTCSELNVYQPEDREDEQEDPYFYWVLRREHVLPSTSMRLSIVQRQYQAEMLLLHLKAVEDFAFKSIALQMETVPKGPR
jgi:hypothetical protein